MYYSLTQINSNLTTLPENEIESEQLIPAPACLARHPQSPRIVQSERTAIEAPKVIAKIQFI